MSVLQPQCKRDNPPLASCSGTLVIMLFGKEGRAMFSTIDECTCFFTFSSWHPDFCSIVAASIKRVHEQPVQMLFRPSAYPEVQHQLVILLTIAPRRRKRSTRCLVKWSRCTLLNRCVKPVWLLEFYNQVLVSRKKGLWCRNNGDVMLEVLFMFSGVSKHNQSIFFFFRCHKTVLY